MKIAVLVTTLFLVFVHTSALAASKQEKCRSVAETIVSSGSEGMDTDSRKSQQRQLEGDCMNKPGEAVDRIYRDMLQLKKETS